MCTRVIVWELSVFIFPLFSSFCGAKRRMSIFISEPQDKYKTGDGGSVPPGSMVWLNLDIMRLLCLFRF